MTHTADNCHIQLKPQIQDKSSLNLTLHFSRRTLRIGWVVILFFYVFNAAYATGIAYLYYYMGKPTMTYYANIIQIMPLKNYRGIIFLYAIIGVMNMRGAIIMIVYSLYYRRLIFKKISKPASIFPIEKQSHRSELTIIKTRTRLWWCRMIRSANSYVSGLAQMFNVRGPLFDVMLLAQEVVEIASQAKQAHYSSFLVSTVWINQIFGVLIFFNAIANAAANKLNQERDGMRRLLCLNFDLLMDVIWGFLLPANIIFNYIPIYIQNGYQFPQELGYSDTFTIKATLECRQFFMISWIDAVTTTIPYLNMLLGLRSIKMLLQHEVDHQQKTGALTAMGPLIDDLVPNKEVPTEKKTKWLMGLYFALHILLPLSGLFVLLTSIVASGLFFGKSDECGHGCKLHMRPWFTSECACSVLEINCYRRGIEGSDSEIRQILEALDERVLNSLIISHCPALTVPPEIRRFKNLLALEFHNDTIVNWPKEASLSLPHTPNLGSIYIARSVLPNGLPEGMTTDLAPNIMDIEIAGTDIGQTLPEDLDEKWSSVIMLYIEHCGLQEFPQAVTSMPLQYLSLVDNNISFVPEDLPEKMPDALTLMFDRNPLTTLPEKFATMPNLYMMSFQMTNVTSIPAWVWTAATDGVMVLGYGTPICENANETAYITLNCYWLSIYQFNGTYPLAMKDAMRQL